MARLIRNALPALFVLTCLEQCGNLHPTSYKAEMAVLSSGSSAYL